MAHKRMFSKSIVQSARFLRMPQSSRLLYYDLSMDADDDGFAEAFTVIRMTGASEDDLKILVAKDFIQMVDDEELVVFINDWTTNNYINPQRYHPSIYNHLLPCFQAGEQMSNNGRTEIEQRTTEKRIEENSTLEENSEEKKTDIKQSSRKEEGVGEGESEKGNPVIDPPLKWDSITGGYIRISDGKKASEAEAIDFTNRYLKKPAQQKLDDLSRSGG